MRAVASPLHLLSALLNRAALIGAIVFVAALVLIAGWQAAARYLLDQPPSWTEELARYLMVWAGMLGASCAYHAKADPALFPEARTKQGRVGKLYAILRATGTLLFVTPVLWYCLYGLNGKIASGYIARNAKVSAETLDVPMAVFALAIPVGFSLILLHLASQLLGAFQEKAPD